MTRAPRKTHHKQPLLHFQEYRFAEPLSRSGAARRIARQALGSCLHPKEGCRTLRQPFQAVQYAQLRRQIVADSFANVRQQSTSTGTFTGFSSTSICGASLAAAFSQLHEALLCRQLHALPRSHGRSWPGLTRTWPIFSALFFARWRWRHHGRQHPLPKLQWLALRASYGRAWSSPPVFCGCCKPSGTPCLFKPPVTVAGSDMATNETQ